MKVRGTSHIVRALWMGSTSCWKTRLTLDRSLYRTYTGTFSLVLMALVHWRQLEIYLRWRGLLRSQQWQGGDQWAGIAQWLERRTRDRKVPGSSPGRSGGRSFFSRVNFLCWLLFRYPFHPRVPAVARKRPRSFCQKCRWQVTAKYTYTLPMWLWMKWQCKLVHGWMVYTQLAPRRQHFTWHQPCNNQTALSVHHFRGY